MEGQSSTRLRGSPRIADRRPGLAVCGSMARRWRALACGAERCPRSTTARCLGEACGRWRRLRSSFSRSAVCLTDCSLLKLQLDAADNNSSEECSQVVVIGSEEKSASRGYGRHHDQASKWPDDGTDMLGFNVKGSHYCTAGTGRATERSLWQPPRAPLQLSRRFPGGQLQRPTSKQGAAFRTGAAASTTGHWRVGFRPF